MFTNKLASERIRKSRLLQEFCALEIGIDLPLDFVNKRKTPIYLSHDATLL
jgi:hypothetical protein